MKSPSSESFARAKRDSTGQLLLAIARMFDERARARLSRRGGPQIRAAHTRLLPHLDVAGTRITELARRLDITKQAVGQLVDEMCELGFLEIAPDPSDGRAKLVTFSQRGMQAMWTGLEALAAVEEDVAAKVGKRKMRELHALLVEVHDAISDG